MAKIEIKAPRPKVTLELTWEEFEVIAGSVAKAQPDAILDFLRFNSKNARPALNNLQELNRVAGALYCQFADTIKKGV